MEPWKRGIHRVLRSTQLLASMGPRRWSRGRDQQTYIDYLPVALLQWGHGVGAVEELVIFVTSPATWLASMGPRRWSRGRATGCDGAIRDIAASMGPRRWSRGRDRHVHERFHAGPARASMG